MVRLQDVGLVHTTPKYPDFREQLAGEMVERRNSSSTIVRENRSVLDIYADYAFLNGRWRSTTRFGVVVQEFRR